MSDATTIDGFLTLTKGSRTFLTTEPSILYIGTSFDGENWAHKWYIKDVPLPVSLAEAQEMFAVGLENQGETDDFDAWFDVAFTERNSTRTFTGKALMVSIAHAGVRIKLQGTTELIS